MSEIQEIAQLGAPVLRLKAAVVEDVHSAEIKSVINDLLLTLAESEGVGLAAPQISASWRIMVVASRPSKRYPQAPTMQPTVMINPSFKVLEHQKVTAWEGCLSIPSIRGKVPRYIRIEICYMTQQGEWVEVIFDDFLARIFQHEYDHLEGVVYLDRVENNHDIISEAEFFKLPV